MLGGAFGSSGFVVDNIKSMLIGDAQVFQPSGKYSPLKMGQWDGWANGEPDDGTAATHDASAGAVPSFTTAKKRQICIATVAGTLGGRTVSKGDLLMALRNNPTEAGHWAIIADSTAELEAALLAAEGSDVYMNGTFLLKKLDSNRLPMNLKTEGATILNKLGVPAIWTRDNDYITDGTDSRTVPTSTSTLSTTSMSVGDTVSLTITNPSNYDFKVGECAYWRSTSSRTVFVEITGWDQGTGVLQGEVIWFFGTGSSTSWTIYSGGQAGQLMVPVSSLGKGRATDSILGTSIADVGYVNLTTAGDYARFHIGQKVLTNTNKTHISATTTDYLTNVGTVTAVDASNNRVYLDRVPKYWDLMSTATSLYLAVLNVDTPVNIEGGLFMGAPTIVGGEVGWHRSIYGSDPITVTVSGSGDTRTLTYSGTMPSWEVNQCVVIQSTYNWPCKITAVDTNAKTLTVSVPKSGSNYVDDKGDVHSVPTSGSVDTVPGFWNDEYDNTSHGGMVVAQNAHGSRISFQTARMWGPACRPRYSHYVETPMLEALANNAHVGTGIATRSWRLPYLREDYASSMGRGSVKAQNIRHPFTGGGGGTSSTWEPYFYLNKIGAACEPEMEVESLNTLGGATDTHTLQPGARLRLKSKAATGTDSAHTYAYGIHSQSRSEDGTYIMDVEGGFYGHRIANGSAYVREAGNWERHDIRAVAGPLHDSGHAFSGGSDVYLGAAMMFQSQTAYTHKTLVEGKLDVSDWPAAFILEEDTTVNYDKVLHGRVGYCAGYIQDGAVFRSGEGSLNYSIPGGVATTSTTSVSLGTGSKSFTLPTGLTMRTGQKVLVQDSANPRTNYGWGHIVSYDSGTGAASFYLDGYEGSGTISDWLIVVGVKAPRFGIVMTGASTVDITEMNVTLGAGSNPDELFHDYDDTSGKVLKVGQINIKDPYNVGMPDIVTSGKEAHFTFNVGPIYYNGQRVSVPGISYKDTSGVVYQAVLNSGGGWTNMPLAETFLAGSNRHIRKVDLTGFSQVRIVGNVQTVGVAGSKLYPKFRATYDATVGNYTNLSSGACEFILTNTGPYESAWVDIDASAIGEVILCIAGSGGDGATTPSIGNLVLEFR